MVVWEIPCESRTPPSSQINKKPVYDVHGLFVYSSLGAVKSGVSESRASGELDRILGGLVPAR